MRGERRLPVFDTAHDIFAFTWRVFATIVRLSWCPLLLASLAGYFATRTATVIPTVFLAIAAWAVVAPALHRVALFGDRQPGTFLNLRMFCLSIVVTTPAFIVADTWQWLLLTVLKVTPAAMTAEQFDGSLLELPALTWPISIVLGALCVGILSYSYKPLAGFAPDAEMKPVA